MAAAATAVMRTHTVLSLSLRLCEGVRVACMICAHVAWVMGGSASSHRSGYRGVETERNKEEHAKREHESGEGEVGAANTARCRERLARTCTDRLHQTSTSCGRQRCSHLLQGSGTIVFHLNYRAFF